MTRLTIKALQKQRDDGVKIAQLTCYDASFAAMLDAAGLDSLLVGDSLGNVIQGHETTLPVKLADMAYHTACVARGSKRAFLIADMPFGTYQESPQQAFRSAAELMAAGAQMVKLEGGAEFAETVRFLAQRGVPVCGHLGLTPQSVHKFGGYRVQGKGDEAEQKLIEDAIELESAGAELLVLEAIPARLGEQVTQRLRIPTIGIGAGPGCSGQVLVLHDMLDVFPGKKARFVRNFMKGASSIADAAERYVRAVRDGSFPAEEHSF
ncbi:MAG TPA: 3-methyl-2-oxobutanoate hydroxymethyltransferase [Burkholderiales bacterium]|nr:3-methyl-2-oxobutanoate hydroxymethyltransferase [Burkholderiales bacterium]HUK05360.1 3-methyl-2-oxobutanoate hydroxymethyltransferase [Burkholderiales bacterium]